MARAIGTLGTVPVLNIGSGTGAHGRMVTDLTNLITLVGPVSSTSVYSSFRKSNSSGGYQVTSGKTLTLAGIRAINGTTSTITFRLLYGDTDVGINSGSGPTNPVNEYNGTFQPYTLASIAGPNGDIPYDSNFAVAAQKYLTVLSGNSVTIFAYGYET